ncbi:hypothetical protein IMG5_195730, partial [Ichthyophthirius multifiliis]
IKMDEILELQRQLAQIQEQTTQNKFSDRVIVDLINKLIQEYNLTLIYSSDGQEYMTPEHLDNQIQQLTQEKGVQTLQTIHNYQMLILKQSKVVYLKYQRKTNENSQDQKTKQQQVHIQTKYVKIQMKIYSKDRKYCLQKQAKIYNLTMQFIKDQLQSRIDQRIIDGNIVGGEKICTSTFQLLMKAKLRGSLRAATKPIVLGNLSKEFGIENKVLQEIIEELINQEYIEGKIHTGSFIPQKFQKNQENIIRNFLKQNNYIEYSMLQKQLYVQKPQDTLKNMFKDQCVLLEDCAFFKDSLNQLQEQIHNLLIEEGYTDLVFMFPTIITKGDIDSIIFKHMKLTEVEIDETYIFSHKFIEKCVNNLKQHIINELQQNPQKIVQQQQEDNFSEEEEEENFRKGKKKQQNQKKQPNTNKNKSSQNKKDTYNNIFSQQEFIQKLQEQNVLPKNEKDEIFEKKLFKVSQNQLQKHIETLRKELLDKKKSGSSEAIQQLIQLIEESVTFIQFSLNSIKSFENNHSDINLKIFYDNIHYTNRMLIENIIVLLCKKLSISLPQGLFIKKEYENPKKNVQIGFVVLKKIFKDKKMLQEAISLLPKEYSQFLGKAFEFYSSKSVNNLFNFLMENQNLIGIRVIFDKKVEKGIIQSLKYFYKDLIKKDRLDFKQNILRTSIFILIDKFNLFYIGSQDENNANILYSILLSLAKENTQEEIYNTLKKSLDCLEVIKQEQKDANDIRQFENSVIELIKIAKL